jgi:hypothetical protein
MYTSLTCLALACTIPLTGLNAPLVHSSYGDAKEASRRSGRPMAVFVAKANAVEPVLQEGALSAQARKVLAERYVCVVLDPSTMENRKLVDALGITQEAGLVISDRSGSVQAYHHNGKIGGDLLVRQLERFADPEVEVTTTQSNVVVVVPQAAAPVCRS